MLTQAAGIAGGLFGNSCMLTVLRWRNIWVILYKRVTNVGVEQGNGEITSHCTTYRFVESAGSEEGPVAEYKDN